MNTELPLVFAPRGCPPTVAWQDRGAANFWGQGVRHLIILAGIAVALLIGASLLLEEGEVVTLVTTNDAGQEFETGLWIVDIDGASYLRAESASASWLDRIRARSDVQLERAGRRAPYRAIPLDGSQIRDAVNQAMDEKYGGLDRALVMFWDHSHAVPIRLLSRSADDSTSHNGPRVGAVR
jgi:hypothetical protein